MSNIVAVSLIYLRRFYEDSEGPATIVPAVVIPLDTLLERLMNVIVVNSGATSFNFFITLESGANVVSTKRMTFL